ncbi:MAG: hypothetical protein GWO08_03195 [Gammaproteobacteria bacterium]|nr:hypothetical protein [Gammaproteobacteria bacterium]NIR92690.1 hypothetical protein [Gammaproteobacteria bacterium]NIW48356.1 hypothetical protein [Gammaproteobacteria bacterium]
MIIKSRTPSIRHLTTLLLLVPAILLSSGCSLFGGGEKVDVNDKSVSVVFGYFDMQDAPSWGGIDWVSVKQYKPKQTYYSCGVDEGLFYHIGVKNGASIQVDQFGRNTRWYSNATYTYNFGGNGRNETSKIIKKPGVYFLGSYDFKNIDSGSFFKPDNFDMVKSKSPGEKQLLTKLLDIMKNDSDLSIYSHQIGMIKKRIAQLK